ncbi:hypothetical protein [Burkholderia pseudomallei]|uniref:hypothetical protein n=1 Tax=Burkholderia pseudomallei TaxID=28450 RepID=UPI000537650A|nr:hypothetical protein [Burkholderia pseudomallei]KGX17593.1 hypothetical protein X896_782 [Burkholderia pseudomallei ABCPW 1]
MGNTTTYGPFDSFEEMMSDAGQRAPYVERAMQIVLTASVFEQLNDEQRDVNLPLDVLIDNMAKQCGMVIKNHEDGPRLRKAWYYELDDQRTVTDRAESLNERDVILHLTAMLEHFAGMQETHEQRLAAMYAQHGRMCLKQRPHPISSRPYAERQRMAFNMRDFAGGFAQKLAHAWINADMSNCRRIEEAFPHLFAKYNDPSYDRAREAREGVPA